MATTPLKKPPPGITNFEEALISTCLQKGSLACAVADITANSPSFPLRSEVLLLKDLADTSEDPPDTKPMAAASSRLSYLWSPIKTTASVVGATASFVLKSPDYLAKALLPHSEYDDDLIDEHEEIPTQGEYVLPTDVVVARSLLTQTTNAIKIAVEAIPPAILSASQLRIALTPKLKDILDESHIAWLHNLSSEHWIILIRQAGLDAVPEDEASDDRAAPLYIIGETKQPQEVRVALHRLDDNLASLESTVAIYESKMQAERAKACRATTKNTKIHAMRIYKVYETKINEAYASRLNLLHVRESIEGAASQRDTIAALKAASSTLKTLRVDEDEAFDVMDELQTNLDETTLDAKLMSQNSPMFDDQELLDELNALTVMENDTSEPSSSSDLPTKNLPDISEAELKELDELEKETKSAPKQCMRSSSGGCAL